MSSLQVGLIKIIRISWCQQFETTVWKVVKRYYRIVAAFSGKFQINQTIPVNICIRKHAAAWFGGTSHTCARTHTPLHAEFLRNFITTTQKKNTLRVWCTLSHANIYNIDLLLLVFDLRFSQLQSMEGTAAETPYCAGSAPLCFAAGEFSCPQ